jgi:hypothetical protein
MASNSCAEHFVKAFKNRLIRIVCKLFIGVLTVCWMSLEGPAHEAFSDAFNLLSKS